MESHEARELQLYIDNTQAYYKQKIAIFTNYAKKKDKGTFVFDKAPQGFKGLLVTAAKSYVREHGSMHDKWQNIFGMIARKHVADAFSREFLDWYREDWPSLRPVKKTRGK